MTDKIWFYGGRVVALFLPWICTINSPSQLYGVNKPLANHKFNLKQHSGYNVSNWWLGVFTPGPHWQTHPYRDWNLTRLPPLLLFQCLGKSDHRINNLVSWKGYIPNLDLSICYYSISTEKFFCHFEKFTFDRMNNYKWRLPKGPSGFVFKLSHVQGQSPGNTQSQRKWGTL